MSNIIKDAIEYGFEVQANIQQLQLQIQQLQLANQELQKMIPQEKLNGLVPPDTKASSE